MSRSRLTRMPSTCRRALIAIASLVLLVLASSSLAAEPTGYFAIFKQCPRFTPGVNFCLYSKATGGEVRIGGMRIPLVSATTLQGGYEHPETEEEIETFFGALDDETLSKAPQPVPGGLSGIIAAESLPRPLKESFQGLVNRGIGGVTVTTELAKPPSSIGLDTNNLANQEGVGLSLPVKIHITNPFLGSECYLGSSSNPIVLSLTDGWTSPPPPNKPIKGLVGDLELVDEDKVIEIGHNVIVDNSFAVPKASGCGGLYSSLIDAAIDAKLGLPSAAGHNTIIQIDNVELTLSQSVRASEK